VTKIICVGDIHVMDRPPKNATESYTDDIISMLYWIADEADRLKVDAVVWAGDVFHFKQPSKTSHALVLRMIAVVRYYRKKGLKLYIVTGNHDISNDVLATVHEKQPLGVLYKAGAVELVGWDKTGLPLFGVPWQANWTTDESASMDAFYNWRVAKHDEEHPRYPERSLAVTHAPIYPPGEAEKQLFELVPTQGEHGLSAAMGNEGFLYYGHIHEYHSVFEVEGVTYANMGAISRGSLTEYNIEREIKVALWTDGAEERFEMSDGTGYTTLGEPGFIEIPVPHKPAEEVLKIAQASEEKADKISLDSFLSEVGHSTLDISNTSNVISHIQSREDVPEKVKKTAIEILEEVG